MAVAGVAGGTHIDEVLCVGCKTSEEDAVVLGDVGGGRQQGVVGDIELVFNNGVECQGGFPIHVDGCGADTVGDEIVDSGA